ncbi:hypothetical protein [Falsiroseomonas sp. HW251]|uniref:hypothetical protein n=1 Tax=Falsiroseomonas sp. HW251 TaxID=3390998 RepID=UPI003D315BCF
MGQTDEIRDALYYPYIRVRDEQWLKAALLYFPHIVRMMPRSGYIPDDTRFVQALSRTRGRRGRPLLDQYEVQSPAVSAAAARFGDRVAADLLDQNGKSRHFSREATRAAYQGDDSRFQLVGARMTEPLRERLEKANLLWKPERPNSGGEWIAMHPVLGEAFLATIATAAARDWGLEILTDAPNVHAAAVTNDEDIIYDALVRGTPKSSQDNSARTFRLAHMVIANHFDISRLSATDLAAMSSSGDALDAFRNDLAKCTRSIGSMGSEERLRANLKAASDEIVERWRAKRASLSNFAKSFFGAGALDTSKDALTKALETLPVAITAGGASVTVIGPQITAVLPGLAVGFAIYSVKTWKDLKKGEKDDPTRYLSLLAQHGATMMVAPPDALD